MKRIYLAALLPLFGVQIAHATVCGADVWFANHRSSDVVIELWQFETYETDVPAPPKGVFSELSPKYFARSMKVRIPAGTNDKGVFRVGCGARTWFNWRTLESDPAASGQIELLSEKSTIDVR